MFLFRALRLVRSLIHYFHGGSMFRKIFSYHLQLTSAVPVFQFLEVITILQKG